MNIYRMMGFDKFFKSGMFRWTFQNMKDTAPLVVNYENSQVRR